MHQRVRRLFTAFPPDVSKYIFTGLLCNRQALDLTSLTWEAYACWESYFVFVNHSEGSLTNNERRRLNVSAFFKLVSFHPIWPRVMTHAMCFCYLRSAWALCG